MIDPEARDLTSNWTPALRLFGLSFSALFLELMVIRWAPSQVRLVAYYANLLLISSFLGLGIGAIIGTHRRRLFGAFFAPLLMLNVLVLLAAASATLPSGGDELRFQQSSSPINSYVILVLIFVCNSATFIPLGQEIGVQFHRLSALRAYAWDLGGSLCGTVCFALFSALHFSPVLGMAVVALTAIALGTLKQRLISLPFFVVIIAAMLVTDYREHAFWSPYHFITIYEEAGEKSEAMANGMEKVSLIERQADTPPIDLRTMIDPPFYGVRVNGDFYQLHGDCDPARYPEQSWRKRYMFNHLAQYSVPYQVKSAPARVLVLGAGGGMDVEAALLNGAGHVDAVEIDPEIARISNRFNAAAPYQNPTPLAARQIDDSRPTTRESSGVRPVSRPWPGELMPIPCPAKVWADKVPRFFKNKDL